MNNQNKNSLSVFSRKEEVLEGRFSKTDEAKWFIMESREKQVQNKKPIQEPVGW